MLLPLLPAGVLRQRLRLRARLLRARLLRAGSRGAESTGYELLRFRLLPLNGTLPAA